jgi:hypothetical protein
MTNDESVLSDRAPDDEIVYRHNGNLDFFKSELFGLGEGEVSDDRWREFCTYNDDDGHLREIVKGLLRAQFSVFPYPWADRD